MPSITIDDATRLRVYNGALRIIGSRRLKTLTEERESRRLLDDVYNDEGVKYCLQAGQWKFAMRAVKLTADSDITPSYGLTYAFKRPDDIIRTSYFCVDPYYKQPLLNYMEAGGYWFADVQDVYLQYVSSATGYGRDTSKWPETFFKFVQAFFASRVVKQVSDSSANKQDVDLECKMCLEDALSKDQMEGPQRRIPPGSFVAARQGRYSTRNDWGNDINGPENV